MFTRRTAWCRAACLLAIISLTFTVPALPGHGPTAAAVADIVTMRPPGEVRSNGADLMWTRFASMDGNPFLRYEVHRSTTVGFVPSAATLMTTIGDLDTTSWSDTTAAPAKSFFYRVKAFSVGGVPAQTAELSVTTPAAGQATITVQPDGKLGQAGYLSTDVTSPTGCEAWQNHGAAEKLPIGVSADGVVRRPLLRFDLRDIPAGATISSATLTLKYLVPSTDVVNTDQIDVHRVTRSWTEGKGPDTGACDGSGASWSETQGGARWSTPGGDLDATPDASIPARGRTATGTDSVNLLSLVREWVSGQAPNHGLLLKNTNETIPSGGQNWFVYDSDDSPAGAARPSLKITYTDGSRSTGPVAAITEPTPGATVSGAAVPVRANVADDSRVTKVEFLSGGAVFATDTTAPFESTLDTSPDSNATRQLTVRATDDVGNATTSSAVTVTVDNGPPPLAGVFLPSANSQLSGTVALTAEGEYPSADRAQFLVDGELVGEMTGGQCWNNCSALHFTFNWNTQHPQRPAANGTHSLVARVFRGARWSDSTPVSVTVQNDTVDAYDAQVKLNDPARTDDDVVPPMVAENTAALQQDPYAGTVDPATGVSGGSLNRSVASAPTPPQTLPAPTQSCPVIAYCASVWIKNDSVRSWDGTKVKLWYRWFADNGAVLFEAPTDSLLPAAFAPGASQSLPVTIQPPKLPPGAELGRYQLRLDLYDEVNQTWFSAKGKPPVDNPVVVAKSLDDRLGLERFWHYDAEPAGAGMTTLTNIANGDMLLRWTPFFAPGRGLASMVDLTYNALEDHSTSPAGNNFSLSMSGLTRLGEPLDIHPNKADQISGNANKFVEFADGDGTLHHFTGATGADGVTRWAEPAGVNLYLRSIPNNSPDRRWALTRPDNVTFYFDDEGFPTASVDRNGNTIGFILENTPPGEDPGGPKKRITRVTDAGGRAFTIDYFSKDEAKKAHVRGKVQRILDHSGSVLDFEYYDDGNLLRLIQRGGTKATGELLADRSFVFTYTTSSGDGPAITDPAARANPEPKTPNQSTRIFSVRDPRGVETTYDYYGPSEGAQLRWKLQSRTNRAGAVTGFGYDLTNRVTTVSAPLNRVTRFSYDTDGKVTRIVNPLNEATSVEWTADFKVSKVTEPTGQFSSYGYNANGYLTFRANQLGERSELTYLDQAVDANDAGRHLSLVSTVTRPKGVATTGIPDDFRWGYSYDSAGNLDRVTEPGGAVTDLDYNLAGSANPGTIAATRDANGNPPTTFPNYDPSGQPTEIRDPLGQVTRIAYDVDGLVRWIQDPNHANDSGTDERAFKAFFDYDSFHRLGRQSAPKSTRFERGTVIWSNVDLDANDNVLRSMDPHYGSVGGDPLNGSVTTTTFDAMDRPLVISNPDTTVDPAGERMVFGYDAAGRVAKVTRPKGTQSSTVDDYTTVLGYDLMDRVVKRTDFGVDAGQSRTSLMCYDLAGDLRTATLPRSGLPSVTCPATSAPHTVELDYDAAHRTVVARDPLGHEVRTSYDSDGNVTAREQEITPGRVARTSTDYDQMDRSVQITQRFDGAAGRDVRSRIEYDRNGNRKRLISPRGVDTAPSGPFTNYVTTFQYDAANRLSRMDLPFDGRDGTEREYVHRAYDANGNLVSTSLPVTSANAADVQDTARVPMTLFDPGWIRTSDDPANPKVHFDYAAQGWQTTRVPERRDAPGELDESLRMLWEFFPDGRMSTRKDQGGQATTFRYDAHNNLMSSVDNSGVTDPTEKAVELEASYTGFDEVAKTRHRKQGDAVWTFTDFGYDANGNVTLRRENGEENTAGAQTKAPRRQELSYDEANWLTQQLDLGTDSACKDDERIVTEFFSAGWEKQRDTYRAGDGCAADPASWPKKQTTTWTHFDNGKLRDLVTRNGSGQTTESHQVSYTDSNGIYVNGNRTADRYVLERASGNGASTCRAASPCQAVLEYDARDKLLRNQQRAGKETRYTLDQPAMLLGDKTIRAGNVTTEVDGATTLVRRYTGDQLTELSAGGSTAKYWYDPLGNLDCVTASDGTQSDCSPNDNTASTKLLADYTYDYLNRLSVVRQYSGGSRTDKADYTYDALDRTVKEIEDHAGAGKDRTTNFTYQGMTNLVTEEKQAGGDDPKTKTFSYDAYGHRIGMTDLTNATGARQTYGYGVDVHGSASQLIDDAGTVRASYGYNAYGGSDASPSDGEALTTGDTDAQAPLNPMRYSGRRVDSGTASSATSQPGYDMGARRFGPDIGRFLQADRYYAALSDLGLALDPLTQNRYGLAGGNPVSFVEIDGHMPMADGGGGGSSTPAPAQPAQQTRSGDDCAARLDCSIEDFNQMPVSERKEFVNDFMRLYGARYNVEQYFNNINGVLNFMQDDGVAGTNTWSSWVDSTILHGFERGLAMAEGRSGGSQGNPGADHWATFFRYSQRSPSADSDTKRQLWSEGEEASTSHGYGVAAQQGASPSVTELAFAAPAHIYRWGMRHMDVARGAGRTAGMTLCPTAAKLVCGWLGGRAAEDFLDPRNSGPTYYGGHVFHGLGEMATLNPGGAVEVATYGGKGAVAAASWVVDQFF